ncbi:MAG: hypothetical protein C0507_22670 [Cyanobacteria bacterium PR.3.49]|nr:hypothetical protein [Cyanobacteria bacterium PR.3.49]
MPQTEIALSNSQAKFAFLPEMNAALFALIDQAVGRNQNAIYRASACKDSIFGVSELVITE